MTNRQKNVASQGKDPGSLQMGCKIPEKLYLQILKFRDEHASDDSRNLLKSMFASCMYADEQDGKTYAEMLDLYEFFCEFTKLLEDTITNEFDRKANYQVVAA